MMKGIKVMILSLLSLFLISCIQTQEIEKLGLINAIGIDESEDSELDMTLVVFQFSEQSEEITKTIYGQGRTVKGAMDDAESSSIFKLGAGKINLSVFGREMAEKGVLPLLDSQARDAKQPDLMYLAVSDTSAEDILTINGEQLTTDVGQALRGIIENHSSDHNIPRKTIQDFLRIYFDVGQDNVLPLFSIEKDIPKLSAIAIFRGDSLVGEISNDEAIFINLVDRVVKEQQLKLLLPIKPFEPYLEKREDRKKSETIRTTFLIDKSKSKTKLVDKDNLVFQTETTMELRLLEQSEGIKLEGDKIIKLIEKEVEKEVETQLRDTLTKLKKMEADPFGYGLYYKRTQKGKNLTNEEWREKFPEIDVKFKVNVEIIRHGVTD